MATHHNTRAIPLPSGSYDDDTVALILAMTTLALMISVTVSMLVFLKIV
jgi:phosphoglycerate dehydrogenase-like enzyme